MSQATLSGGYHNSNLFSNYYLDERIYDLDAWECDEEAAAVFDELRDLYDLEQGLVEGYGEDALIDNWIDEVLEILGFGTQVETTLPEGDGFVDALLFENPDKRRNAAQVYLDTNDTIDLFERGFGIVEAKQWDADFGRRFSEQRPYHNASQQVKRYLGKTPDSIQWGILTNGRKWRLYGTKDYEEQTYYEVDLPELLERGDLETFKYFYVFFRPEAFREVGGETFLDEVWSESETAAQELGEDLQDNVFTALRVLGRGFVETNDLEISPDDEAALDELKEQSLVLLYRLMFVLYAESRGLIHPEGGQAETEYEENFSLDALRLEIHDEIGEVDEGFDSTFSEYSTSYWSRLQDLFRLIDEGEESLGIPPYNGGLFDQGKHSFLSENEVSNRYLAEVIYRLSTTRNDEDRYVLADYADLDTRHLGSVYEGLLEHKFQIAPEEYAAIAADAGQIWKPATEVTVAEAIETVPKGGLYVVNDKGERKATGAYYTPDYVVTYIVEETVEPLVDEIRDDLVEQGFEPGTQEYLGPFLRRVTDLKILDPAMGSGHFLTRATGFLAERVMDEVREVETELGVAFDEQHVRREIAKECIYGVDINGMAVELAKLSMWLETLAADRPLAFLDHHLKAGNSLVGSDVTEVLTDDNGDDGQLTLTQALARVRKDTLEHVMELMEDLLAIDNETLEDVHSMEDIYDEIRADPLYQRLFELTNVHTAEQFGLDVPDGAYEEMAGTIEVDDEWARVQEKDWFQRAQSIADEESFFHWELEYPEAFFGEDGQKLAQYGFDAVVGNPPYLAGREWDSGLRSQRQYLEEKYSCIDDQFDIYGVFIQRGLEITTNGGSFSYITPSTWLNNSQYEKLRKWMVERVQFEKIGDFRNIDVFPDVTVLPIVFVCEFTDEPEQGELFDIEDFYSEFSYTSFKSSSEIWGRFPEFVFNLSLTRKDMDVIDKIEDTADSLGTACDVRFGVKVYQKGKGEPRQSGEEAEEDLFRSESKDSEDYYPYVRGRDIERWYITDDPGWINYGSHLAEPRSLELFSSPRIFVRRIVGSRLIVVPATETIVADQLLHTVKPDAEDVHVVPLSGILGSTLITYYFRMRYNRDEETFPEIRVGELESLPTIVTGDGLASTRDGDDGDSFRSRLEDNVSTIVQATTDRKRLNLNLLDHLGSYSGGPTLADVGFSQPPEDAANSILQETTEQYPNLRVGEAEIERKSPSSAEIRLTARYKPEDEDANETDQWGYTETDPLPAIQITELTETEADLIEHFVPVAVAEAGGFGDFRETATKTNSLIDRLRKLTLPAVEDIREGLESYIETKERAAELDEKIEQTDELIDEIVYELYGLTDEEIEIVEEAVGD